MARLSLRHIQRDRDIGVEYVIGAFARRNDMLYLSMLAYLV